MPVRHSGTGLLRQRDIEITRLRTHTHRLYGRLVVIFGLPEWFLPLTVVLSVLAVIVGVVTGKEVDEVISYGVVTIVAAGLLYLLYLGASAIWDRVSPNEFVGQPVPAIEKPDYTHVIQGVRVTSDEADILTREYQSKPGGDIDASPAKIRARLQEIRKEYLAERLTNLRERCASDVQPARNEYLLEPGRWVCDEIKKLPARDQWG